MNAKEYGAKAYKEGLEAIPALDYDFISKYIDGILVGEGSIGSLREWLDGWHEENIKDNFEIKGDL